MTTDEHDTWKRLNECKCVRKIKGDWTIRDLAYDNANQRFAYFDGSLFVDSDGWGCSDDLIWIPPLHDPLRPERSLWGMSEDIRADWSVVQAGIFIASERPDLFLAEAIIEQEVKQDVKKI